MCASFHAILSLVALSRELEFDMGKLFLLCTLLPSQIVFCTVLGSSEPNLYVQLTVNSNHPHILLNKTLQTVQTLT